MIYYQKSKYKSKRCRCNQQHVHQSKGEAAYCNDLALRVLAGDLESYETQKTFPLYDKNGKKISSHRPDFLLTNFDGTREVHEFKGYQTELWKLKKALFESNYPDIPYIVIYHK